MSSETTNTGIVGGHAAYAKGAAETLVGNVTGSDEWKQAGEQIKSEATDAIRQAADNRQPADDATLAGKAEKAAEQACPIVGGGIGQTKEE